jgi:hypothetical protein
LEQKSFLTVDKLNGIKKLIEVINRNKKHIEQLIDINSILIDKPIEIQNQIEDSIETLPDQMRSLNLNQSSLFSTFNTTSISFASTSMLSSLPILDDYFINDFEQFKSKLKPDLIKAFNSNDSHSKDVSTIIDYLHYPDYKSKHCVLDELLTMINFIEKNNSIENIETMQTLNDLSYLESSLEKCKEEDKQNVSNFTDLINKRIDTCVKWKNTKHEVSFDEYLFKKETYYSFLLN